MTGPTFSQAELADLTRYARPSKQLAVLRLRGFHRAYLDHAGHVVLERAHYEAVCRGEAQAPRPRVKLQQPTVKRLSNGA